MKQEQQRMREKFTHMHASLRAWVILHTVTGHTLAEIRTAIKHCFLATVSGYAKIFDDFIKIISRY